MTTNAGCLEVEQQHEQQQQQLVARPPIHPASFDKLDPRRKDQVFLYYEKDVQTTDDEKNNENFRYKLTIVDRHIVLPTTTKLAYATAVFLIPAGRESEYLFSSLRGLQNIAASAGTARLVAVSLGRHHVFTSQQAVQQELTYVVQILARQGSFLSKSKSSTTATAISTTTSNDTIPFMALDGIGRRNIIAQGTSDASGPYLVEQVQVDDGRQVRRLYFMNNPFVIQTEVFLLSDKNNETDSSNSSNQNQLDPRVDKSRAAFEYHKIMAAGILALSSSASSTSSSSSSSTTRGLLIGLGGGGLVNYMSHVFWTPSASSSSSCTLTAIELDPTMVDIATRYFGLVVPIPNQTMRQQPANDNSNGATTTTTTTTTMDNTGHASGVSLDIRIGNGLDISVVTAQENGTKEEEDDDAKPESATVSAATNAAAVVAVAAAAEAVDTADAPRSDISFAPGIMSFIVIDVDSKDNSKGMSCPPQSFIEIDYLQRLSQLLVKTSDDRTDRSRAVNGGVLVINVSARDPEMLSLVCQNARKVFNTVILSSDTATTNGNNVDQESEDVNVVVFAKNSSQHNDDSGDGNISNDILSNRSLLSDRLDTLLQRNPNMNDECISDLKSTIQDFAIWNDNVKSQPQHAKKAGGGGGKNKSNKKKNKRGGKKK